MIAAMLVMVLLSTYEAQIKRSYPTLEDVILASLELNRGVLVLFLFLQSKVGKQAIS
jgi:hypothetical protein